ncbi:NADH-cytochrome b5 reductase-like isoform X1 [Hetaerina americana]|uniref:NADH-cytochrome b5 reductase-like isoform X1 n=1 Tax=Hetaerina americana TaxID=62018 RepID=UPI003A7F4894
MLMGHSLEIPDMDANRGDSGAPRRPEEPSQADCCGSGCSYCVFDVYQRELAKWEKECERLMKGGKPSKVNETLSPLEFKTFPLIRITPTAEQMNVYRFSVVEGSRLDILPGQHLMMKGFIYTKWDEEEVNESNEGDQSVIATVKSTDETFLKRKYLSRAYTILNNQPGYFETLIKTYSDGKMSHYVRTLKVGDFVPWRGPFGDYCHNPSYSPSCANGAETILAICAGTGIAPVYAISKSIVSDEDDETRLRLLWANHSWNHLPLVPEIKELTSYWNFSCRLFLTNGGDVPPGSNTFFEIDECKINLEVLGEEVSILATNVKVLLCGSLSFEEDMLAFLNKLGLQNSICHRFQ